MRGVSHERALPVEGSPDRPHGPTGYEQAPNACQKERHKPDKEEDKHETDDYFPDYLSRLRGLNDGRHFPGFEQGHTHDPYGAIWAVDRCGCHRLFLPS